MTRVLRLVVTFSAVALIAACATSRPRLRLVMGSLHGDVASLSGVEDPLLTHEVTYSETGKADYDSFFKEAAILNASLIVSKAVSETAMGNLKASANTYASVQANDEKVKEIVGSTPMSQLSEEQVVAISKIRKERKDLSEDELKFYASTAANVALLVSYLSTAVQTAVDLAQTGSGLTERVSTDFTGMDSTKAPGVISELAESAKNLQDASSTIPELSKNLVKLGEVMTMLL